MQSINLRLEPAQHLQVNVGRVVSHLQSRGRHRPGILRPESRPQQTSTSNAHTWRWIQPTIQLEKGHVVRRMGLLTVHRR